MSIAANKPNQRQSVRAAIAEYGRAEAWPSSGGGQLQVLVSRPRPDLVIVSVAGELDLVTAPRLGNILAPPLVGAGGAVVVDLSAVGFLAAAGLTQLVDLHRRAETETWRLRLVTGTRVVDRPLEITGLAELIPCHGRLRDAVLSLRGAPMAD